ncbi:hypothetical protein LTSEALA_2898, partial [Salmonella enterica subsp. enterica serovar Alachua str. R6-377]
SGSAKRRIRRKLTSMIQQLKAMSEKVSKTYSANLDNLF